jgi:hypothetical protein
MDFSQVIEVAIVMKVMDVAKLIDGAQMKVGSTPHFGCREEAVQGSMPYRQVNKESHRHFEKGKII